MIARAGAVVAIVVAALLGSSSAASAEMVLARSLMPKAQQTVTVKRQLRRSKIKRVRNPQRASGQRGRTAARATPLGTPARAAASPTIDTFSSRFDAAFPASKKGD